MIWKEAVLAYFKVLSRHFLGETEEITKNMCRYIRSWDRYLNPGPPELEALGLTLGRHVRFVVLDFDI
jgi:hypothetical protein